MLAGGATAAGTTDEIVLPVDTPASYLATYCTDPRSGPCVNPEGPSPAVRQRKAQQQRRSGPRSHHTAAGGKPVQTPIPVQQRSQRQYCHSARSETHASTGKSDDGDLPSRMQLVNGSYVLMPAATPMHQIQIPLKPTSVVKQAGSDTTGWSVISTGVGKERLKKKPSGFQFPASKGKRTSATAAAGAAALRRQQPRLAREQQQQQQQSPLPQSCTTSASGVADSVVALPPTTPQTDTVQVPLRSIEIEEIEDEAASEPTPQHQAYVKSQTAAAIGPYNPTKVATSLGHVHTTSGAVGATATDASSSEWISAPAAIIAAGDSSAAAIRRVAACLEESTLSPPIRNADHLNSNGSNKLDCWQLDSEEEGLIRAGKVKNDTQSTVSSPLSASGEAAVNFFGGGSMQQEAAAVTELHSDHSSDLTSMALKLSSQSSPSTTADEAWQLAGTGTYDGPLQLQRDSVIQGAAQLPRAAEEELVQAPQSAPKGQSAADTADAAATAADNMPTRKQRRGGLNGPSAPAAGRQAGRDTDTAVSAGITAVGPICQGQQELPEKFLEKQQQLQECTAARKGIVEGNNEACAGDDKKCNEPYKKFVAPSEETTASQQPAQSKAPVSGNSIVSDDDAAKAVAKAAADKVKVVQSCQQLR